MLVVGVDEILEKANYTETEANYNPHLKDFLHDVEWVEIKTDLKVERIFLNKNSANLATSLYVLVTNANDYILYKGRMEKVLLGSIGSEH